jgi:hypothetical protein
MSVLKEITDSIKLVADAIKNIKEIHTAIKDGKKYFEKAHPEIKKDVVAMCNELYKTCNAIATASSIITNFRFNGSPSAIDNEPTRFNNYFISFKTNNSEAENLIRTLKGHCHIIKAHADKITNGNSNLFWNIISSSASDQRKAELGQMLQNIYNDEQDFYNVVYQMAKSMHLAIEDVTNALTVNGLMLGTQVPQAATSLQIYAAIFKDLEALATTTRDQISATVDALQ